MNREELKEEINKSVDAVVSENRDLDGDDLDAVQTACEHTINVATEVIDEDVDEAAAELNTGTLVDTPAQSDR